MGLATAVDGKLSVKYILLCGIDITLLTKTEEKFFRLPLTETIPFAHSVVAALVKRCSGLLR